MKANNQMDKAIIAVVTVRAHRAKLDD